MLRPRLGNLVVASAILVGMAGPLAGCRVNENDVHRWSQTEHGPDKLIAVLLHDKYDLTLRTEAGLELVRMKPRNGRRVGINRLVETLAQLSPEERKKIVEAIIPTLLTEMKKPPPVAQAGQPTPPDPSIPYKDAAFLMFTYDKAVIIADETQKKAVIDGLVDWCVKDFEHRLDNSSQQFGMEQVMRAIGAPAVKGLPALIKSVAEAKYDRIASLVAELGDQPTKEAAATELVAIAKLTGSQAWLDKTKPLVEEANRQSKLTPTPAQLQAQVAQYQDEALTRVFAAIKKVGTRPAVDYCLAFAADKANNEKRRQAAAAALEGRLDRNNPTDVQRILAIAAADDTPDSVRDLAFQRVGEMPRDQVVGKLYDLFAAKKWKVRAVSAQTVLRMSTTAQLGEWMAKLPPATSAGFSISEPMFYGPTIEKMAVKDGKSPRDAVMPFLREGSVAARLTALGYFLAVGKPADVSIVAPFEADRTPTPKTDDPEAKWECGVPKGPDGKETEQKPIPTIGDFVKFCVEPQLKKGAS